MAILGATNLTLADIAKRLDKNDKVVDIAEVLAQDNEMLADIPWVEGDSADGLTTSMRTGIPTPTWRRYNEFTQPTKSTVASVTFTCGMMENYSQLDVDLADRAGNRNELRLSEAVPILEGFNQECQRAFLYEDEKVNAGRITGLSPYYSSLSAESGINIVDAGGTGSDNLSIWIVCWSPQSIFGIYPKGSKAGLQHWDLGESTIYNNTGVGAGMMRVLQDRWQWKVGFGVKDWRQAVRIANIDYSNLIAGSGADLVALLYRAINKIKKPGAGKLAVYMRRDVKTILEVQARSEVKAGGGLTYQNVGGVPQTSWNGIPIRIVDQLAINEARVV